jgi:hypothetical protein
MPGGRNWVRGEYLAQLDNRDPFTPPVWRSPVYRTPEAVILVVQLFRLIWRVLWFALTHPFADAAAALVFATWLGLRWPGIAGLAALAVIGLTGLRIMQPVWFARFVAVPVRDRWRWWFYRRRWKAAMILAGLAPDYRGQSMLPVLGRVHRAGSVDLVRVGLVTGRPRPTSPPKPRTWPTRSAPGCAGSATSRPARYCWSWSARTPWPMRSRPCPLPGRWTWPGCRSAGARTGRRGGCGWPRPMC